MKLANITFFCPALNEEKNLKPLIDSLLVTLPKFAEDFEVIIIDDGSTDSTFSIANSLAQSNPRIRVIHHKKNLGYGVSLAEGFKGARCDWVMYTDADFQYDLAEALPYVGLLNNHDILSGFVTKKATSLARELQSKVYNTLVRILFGINIKDINCASKIYSKKVIDAIEIKSKGFFVDAEMVIKASRLGYSIAQYPITHLRRNSGVATGSRPSLIFQNIFEMLRFRLGIL